MNKSITDQFCQPIHVGDRVMYPVGGCADIGYELGFETGEVTAIPTDQIAREGKHIVVLNDNDPRVTLFLLGNSIS